MVLSSKTLEKLTKREHKPKILARLALHKPLCRAEEMMKATIQSLPDRNPPKHPTTPRSGVQRFFVQKVDEQGQCWLQCGEHETQVQGSLAVPSVNPMPGDEVVAMADPEGHWYVLGFAQPRMQPQEIKLKSGEQVSVDDQTIVVSDPNQHILFRYQLASSTLEISTEHDLEFRSEQGKIRLVAKTGCEIETEGTAAVRASEVEITSVKTSIHTRKMETIADKISETSQDIQIRAGRWDLQAERWVERAVDAYFEVDELLQIQSQRMRTLVQKSYQLLAGKTTIASEEDTSVDGKRVLLG
jgi:hypothetical protein